MIDFKKIGTNSSLGVAIVSVVFCFDEVRDNAFLNRLPNHLNFLKCVLIHQLSFIKSNKYNDLLQYQYTMFNQGIIKFLFDRPVSYYWYF